MIDLIRSFRMIRDAALQSSTAYSGRGGAQFAGAIEGVRQQPIRGRRTAEGPVPPSMLLMELAVPSAYMLPLSRRDADRPGSPGIAPSASLKAQPDARTALHDDQIARPPTQTYTVKRGDSLATIAAAHGWADGGARIAEANKLERGASVRTGQTLAVPLVEVVSIPRDPKTLSPGQANSVRTAERRQQDGLETQAATETVEQLSPALNSLQAFSDRGGAAARQKAGLDWGTVIGSVENELRVAADGAEQPQDASLAIERKGAEIRDRLPEGSIARNQLDRIVTQAQSRVATEAAPTRHTRRALHETRMAFGDVDAAERNIVSLKATTARLRKEELPLAQETLSQAQSKFLEKTATFHQSLSQELALEAARIEPDAPKPGPEGLRVYSHETLTQASTILKATYLGEGLDVMIDGVAGEQRLRGQVSVQLDRVTRNDPALGLTEYERDLAKNDPVSLAMILAAGGRIDPDALPGLDEAQRLEVRRKATVDPVGFGLEQIASAGFDATKPQDQLQVTALQAATQEVRLVHTRDQVGQLLRRGDEDGALKLLNINLNATASPQERRALWQGAGEPHFNEDWVKGNLARLTNKARGQPLDHPQAKTRYLDKVGLWLQKKNLPQEVANPVLDGIRANFTDQWYKADDNAGVSGPYGVEFYKGLSRTIEAADRPLFGRSAGNRGKEFAAWLNDPSSKANNVTMGLAGTEGSLLENNISQAIGQGHGARLSEAIVERLKDGSRPNDAYLSDPQRLAAIDRGITGGKRQAANNAGGVVAQRQFEFFEKNKQQAINVRFDHLLKEEDVNTPKRLEGDALKVFIAKGIGLEPKLYDGNSGEGKRVAAIERQVHATEEEIRRHGDEVVGITMIPMIYASRQEGAQESALFKLQLKFNTDHKKMVDDYYEAEREADHKRANATFGTPTKRNELPAPDGYSQRAANAQKDGASGMDFLIGDRAESIGEEARAGRYNDLEHLLNDGPFADEGKIYLPRDLRLAAKADGHADIVDFDSKNVDWWDKVVAGADVFFTVAGTVAGLALVVGSGGLAAPVAGAALTVTGAGTVYGVARSIDQLNDLYRRGQSRSMDNPEASSAWVNLASGVFGLATIGTGVAANTMMRAGQETVQAGFIGSQGARHTVEYAEALGRGTSMFNAGKRLETASGIADLVVGTGATAGQIAIFSHPEVEVSSLDRLFVALGVGQMGAGAWMMRRSPIELVAPSATTPELTSAKSMTLLTQGRDGSYSAGDASRFIVHDPEHPVIDIDYSVNNPKATIETEHYNHPIVRPAERSDQADITKARTPDVQIGNTFRSPAAASPLVQHWGQDDDKILTVLGVETWNDRARDETDNDPRAPGKTLEKADPLIRIRRELPRCIDDPVKSSMLLRQMLYDVPAFSEIYVKSRSLKQAFERALQRADVEIVFGRAGDGSYFDRRNKRIVLDSELASDPDLFIATMAEELGHYDSGTGDPQTSHSRQIGLGLTFPSDDRKVSFDNHASLAAQHDQTIRSHNVSVMIQEEGFAVAFRLKVRQEILDKGGPDIWPDVDTDLLRVVEAYDPEHESNGALAMRLGEIYGKNAPSGIHGDTNYVDYYRRQWRRSVDAKAKADEPSIITAETIAVLQKKGADEAPLGESRAASPRGSRIDLSRLDGDGEPSGGREDTDDSRGDHTAVATSAIASILDDDAPEGGIVATSSTGRGGADKSVTVGLSGHQNINLTGGDRATNGIVEGVEADRAVVSDHITRVLDGDESPVMGPSRLAVSETQAPRKSPGNQAESGAVDSLRRVDALSTSGPKGKEHTRLSALDFGPAGRDESSSGLLTGDFAADTGPDPFKPSAEFDLSEMGGDLGPRFQIEAARLEASEALSDDVTDANQPMHTNADEFLRQLSEESKRAIKKLLDELEQSDALLKGARDSLAKSVKRSRDMPVDDSELYELSRRIDDSENQMLELIKSTSAQCGFADTSRELETFLKETLFSLTDIRTATVLDAAYKAAIRLIDKYRQVRGKVEGTFREMHSTGLVHESASNRDIAPLNHTRDSKLAIKETLGTLEKSASTLKRNREFLVRSLLAAEDNQNSITVRDIEKIEQEVRASNVVTLMRMQQAGGKPSVPDYSSSIDDSYQEVVRSLDGVETSVTQGGWNAESTLRAAIEAIDGHLKVVAQITDAYRALHDRPVRDDDVGTLSAQYRPPGEPIPSEMQPGKIPPAFISPDPATQQSEEQIGQRKRAPIGEIAQLHHDLYEGKLTESGYRQLLRNTIGEIDRAGEVSEADPIAYLIGRFGPERAARIESAYGPELGVRLVHCLDVLKRKVGRLSKDQIPVSYSSADRLKRQERYSNNHNKAVRAVINYIILLSRGLVADRNTGEVQGVVGDMLDTALDLAHMLRQENLEDSQSLILRDADHYFSQRIQEWQARVHRKLFGHEAMLPSRFAALGSDLAAIAYDWTKYGQLHDEAKGKAIKKWIEQSDMPVAAPGGKYWAALGARHFRKGPRLEERDTLSTPLILDFPKLPRSARNEKEPKQDPALQADEPSHPLQSESAVPDIQTDSAVATNNVNSSVLTDDSFVDGLESTHGLSGLRVTYSGSLATFHDASGARVNIIIDATDGAKTARVTRAVNGTQTAAKANLIQAVMEWASVVHGAKPASSTLPRPQKTGPALRAPTQQEMQYIRKGAEALHFAYPEHVTVDTIEFLVAKVQVAPADVMDLSEYFDEWNLAAVTPTFGTREEKGVVLSEEIFSMDPVDIGLIARHELCHVLSSNIFAVGYHEPLAPGYASLYEGITNVLANFADLGAPDFSHVMKERFRKKEFGKQRRFVLYGMETVVGENLAYRVRPDDIASSYFNADTSGLGALNSAIHDLEAEVDWRKYPTSLHHVLFEELGAPTTDLFGATPAFLDPEAHNSDVDGQPRPSKDGASSLKVSASNSLAFVADHEQRPNYTVPDAPLEPSAAERASASANLARLWKQGTQRANSEIGTAAKRTHGVDGKLLVPDEVQARVDPQFVDRLVELVRASGGSIPFSDFMNHSLYGVGGYGGYYNSGTVSIGAKSTNSTAADFKTAPETSKYFGHAIANAIAEVYASIGSPSRFDIVEMGAGNGTLAATIIERLGQAHPELYEALNYIIVERSEALIARQKDRLENTKVSWLHASAYELPLRNVTGVFLSNELPDAFPVHQVVVREGTLREIYVGLNEDNEFVEIEGDLTPALAGNLDVVEQLAPSWSTLPDGQRLTINLESVEWIRKIGRALKAGSVITADYGVPRAAFTPPYAVFREEFPIDLAYLTPGAIDITSLVDFVSLLELGRGVGLEPGTLPHLGTLSQQSQFLRDNGFEDLADLETNPDQKEAAQELLDRFEVFHVLVQQKRSELSPDDQYAVDAPTNGNAGSPVHVEQIDLSARIAKGEASPELNRETQAESEPPQVLGPHEPLEIDYTRLFGDTQSEGSAAASLESSFRPAPLPHLTREKATEGTRDHWLKSGLPVIEDPAGVLYLPSAGIHATSEVADLRSQERPSATAEDARVAKSLPASPEGNGQFQTAYPAKKSEYPLQEWVADYVPETGLFFTQARRVDAQWIFKPNHERRDLTNSIMISPDIYVISAFGTRDSLFDLQGAPVPVIKDLRRRLITPSRLANRLSERFGLDEKSYTPGQPIALLAEYTAVGGSGSFAQELANEVRAPVYGLTGTYEERQWSLFLPEGTASQPAIQPSLAGLRGRADGQSVRTRWTSLEIRDSADLEVLSAEDPVKIDTFLAPHGVFAISGQFRELLSRGAQQVAASALEAGYVANRTSLLLTLDDGEEVHGFARELAEALGGPVLIMTDDAWSRTGNAIEKNTITVSRVEGAENKRISIDENGQLEFLGTKQGRQRMIWLNFGPLERSRSYFNRKREQMDDVELHVFEVPKSVLETIRLNAVHQSDAQLDGNAEKPVMGDWLESPDQFGLRWEQVKELEEQIVPGSARTLAFRGEPSQNDSRAATIQGQNNQRTNQEYSERDQGDDDGSSAGIGSGRPKPNPNPDLQTGQRRPVPTLADAKDDGEDVSEFSDKLAGASKDTQQIERAELHSSEWLEARSEDSKASADRDDHQSVMIEVDRSTSEISASDLAADGGRSEPDFLFAVFKAGDLEQLLESGFRPETPLDSDGTAFAEAVEHLARPGGTVYDHRHLLWATPDIEAALAGAPFAEMGYLAIIANSGNGKNVLDVVSAQDADGFVFPSVETGHILGVQPYDEFGFPFGEFIPNPRYSAGGDIDSVMRQIDALHYDTQFGSNDTDDGGDEDPSLGSGGGGPKPEPLPQSGPNKAKPPQRDETSDAEVPNSKPTEPKHASVLEKTLHEIDENLGALAEASRDKSVFDNLLRRLARVHHGKELMGESGIDVRAFAALADKLGSSDRPLVDDGDHEVLAEIRQLIVLRLQDAARRLRAGKPIDAAAEPDPFRTTDTGNTALMTLAPKQIAVYDARLAQHVLSTLASDLVAIKEKYPHQPVIYPYHKKVPNDAGAIDRTYPRPVEWQRQPKDLGEIPSRQAAYDAIQRNVDAEYLRAFNNARLSMERVSPSFWQVPGEGVGLADAVGSLKRGVMALPAAPSGSRRDATTYGRLVDSVMDLPEKLGNFINRWGISGGAGAPSYEDVVVSADLAMRWAITRLDRLAGGPIDRTNRLLKAESVLQAFEVELASAAAQLEEFETAGTAVSLNGLASRDVKGVADMTAKLRGQLGAIFANKLPDKTLLLKAQLQLLRISGAIRDLRWDLSFRSLDEIRNLPPEKRAYLAARNALLERLSPISDFNPAPPPIWRDADFVDPAASRGLEELSLVIKMAWALKDIVRDLGARKTTSLSETDMATVTGKLQMVENLAESLSVERIPEAYREQMEGDIANLVGEVRAWLPEIVVRLEATTGRRKDMKNQELPTADERQELIRNEHIQSALKNLANADITLALAAGGDPFSPSTALSSAADAIKRIAAANSDLRNYADTALEVSLDSIDAGTSTVGAFQRVVPSLSREQMLAHAVSGLPDMVASVKPLEEPRNPVPTRSSQLSAAMLKIAKYGARRDWPTRYGRPELVPVHNDPNAAVSARRLRLTLVSDLPKRVPRAQVDRFGKMGAATPITPISMETLFPPRHADLNLLQSVVVDGQSVDGRWLKIPAPRSTFLVIADQSQLADAQALADKIQARGRPRHLDVLLYIAYAGQRVADPLVSSFSQDLASRIGARVHAVQGDIVLGARITLKGKPAVDLPSLPLTVKSGGRELPQGEHDARRGFWFKARSYRPAPGFSEGSLRLGARIGERPLSENTPLGDIAPPKEHSSQEPDDVSETFGTTVLPGRSMSET